MTEVIGVRFKKVGKIYYFDPDAVSIPAGTPVIVETARGVEYGRTEIGNRLVDDGEVVQPLKKVIRIATEDDARQEDQNRKTEKDAFVIGLEKIKNHGLDMKLVDVEMTFDLNKIVFYFTSDGRVDFRELVKDLASVFRMRIELRQIGVRDEAKILNGVGICGRNLCCASFLGEFQPVSIKMAKEQSLSLNPSKISGICGRLMCCLKYEEDTYEALNKNLPFPGDTVSTPDGMGEILSVNVLKQIVKAAVRKKASDDPVVGYYALAEIKITEKGRMSIVHEMEAQNGKNNDKNNDRNNSRNSDKNSDKNTGKTAD
ncbi:MAG: stage 0 sporulation family protein [Defluviitaleaceae bacterium]|nr:stage 0 sporulation family protein [Defluviitaleaceae bacterium]